MSRGPGDTQRAILTALADTDPNGRTVPELAAAVDRSDRQVRAAVRSLERRRLVYVERRVTGWNDHGGPLVTHSTSGRVNDGHGDHCRVEYTLVEGDDWPLRDGWEAAGPVELCRQGTPQNGLVVWLDDDERRAAREGRWAAIRAAVRG